MEFLHNNQPKASAIAHAKLASRDGDTFVEVLIALLIAVLATTLLATMILTSTKVTSKSQVKMQAAYNAQSTLARKEENKGNIDVSITSSDGKIDNSTDKNVIWKVPLYQSGDFALYEAEEIEDVQS